MESVEQSGTLGSVLNKKHLYPLIRCVKSAAAKWREIGASLKFSKRELDEIKSQHNAIDIACLAILLARWLRRMTPKHRLPILEDLIKAFDSVGELENIASDIKRKFTIKLTSTDESVLLPHAQPEPKSQSHPRAPFPSNTSSPPSSTFTPPSTPSTLNKDSPVPPTSSTTYYLEFTLSNILDVLLKAEFSAVGWKEFSRRHLLKLDEDAIQQQYNNPRECLEAVVKTFIRDGENATWEGVAEAVEKCRDYGGRNIAARIRELAMVGKSASPQSHLQQYTQQLRSRYGDLKLPAIFQTVAGDEDGPSPSKKFINLVITSREQEQVGEEEDERVRLAVEGNISGMVEHMCGKQMNVPVELENIFSLDNNSRKLILIEGGPGRGKSTLFWHICRRWSERTLFIEFRLLVLVRLRESKVQQTERLAEILPFISESQKEAISREIKSCNGEGVLFLLDGWDELPTEMQQDSLFKALISAPEKLYLQKSAVVVSARPNSSAGLQHHMSARIEILGFTPLQIKEYVQSSIQPKAAESLLSQIKDDPVLESNCSHPLSLAILTHTFLCSGHSLPPTFCGIIQQLALSCLYRHIKKSTPYGHLYKSLNSFENLQGDLRSQFHKLCEKAYTSLVHSQYSLNDADTPTLGLMQTVESFVARGKSIQHYFLHLSLQELCAAKHFLSLEEEEQSRIAGEVMDGRAANLAIMLLFYSALGGWEGVRARDSLTQHVKKRLQGITVSLGALRDVQYSVEDMENRVGEDQWCYANPVVMLLQYMYESQSHELCQVLPQKMSLVKLPLTPRDCVALKFVISHRRFKVLDIIVPLENANCGFKRITAPSLKGNMPKHKLYLHGVDMREEGVSRLAEAIPQAPTNIIGLYRCGLTQNDVKVLSTALCNSTIKELYLSYNQIGDTGLRHISNKLWKTQIRILHVSDCGITDEGVTALSKVLPKATVIGLDLSKNQISDTGLKTLGEAIMKTQLFVFLGIMNDVTSPTIPTDGIKQLLLTLTLHPTFHSLWVNERDKFQIGDTIGKVNGERNIHGLGEIKVYTMASLY